MRHRFSKIWTLQLVKLGLVTKPGWANVCRLFWEQLSTSHLWFSPCKRCGLHHYPLKCSLPHPIKWQAGLRMRQTELRCLCVVSCMSANGVVLAAWLHSASSNVLPLRWDSDRREKKKISFHAILASSRSELNFALLSRDSRNYVAEILFLLGEARWWSHFKKTLRSWEEFNLAQVLLKDTPAMLFTCSLSKHSATFVIFLKIMKEGAATWAFLHLQSGSEGGALTTVTLNNILMYDSANESRRSEHIPHSTSKSLHNYSNLWA